jgi:hypothetical protein
MAVYIERLAYGPVLLLDTYSPCLVSFVQLPVSLDKTEITLANESLGHGGL